MPFAGAVMVMAFRRDQEVVGSTPVSGRFTSPNGDIVHTHMPLSPSTSSIIWYRPNGGDVLRRSGVALAMR